MYIVGYTVGDLVYPGIEILIVSMLFCFTQAVQVKSNQSFIQDHHTEGMIIKHKCIQINTIDEQQASMQQLYRISRTQCRQMTPVTSPCNAETFLNKDAGLNVNKKIIRPSASSFGITRAFLLCPHTHDILLKDTISWGFEQRSTGCSNSSQTIPCHIVPSSASRSVGTNQKISSEQKSVQRLVVNGIFSFYAFLSCYVVLYQTEAY